MRSRSSATTEITVIPQSTRRSVDISPLAPVSRGGLAGSGDRSSLATPRIALQPKEIDACLFMFAVCKHLQMTCLDERGIDCLLDADGTGRLPEVVCRMLGLMVCELVQDASVCSQPETAGRAVTVILRRRGTTCLCTISRQGFDGTSEGMQPGLQRVRSLVRDLGSSCMIRLMPDRGTAAIMFDVPLVARCLPEAIWRYRAREAWRRAVRHPPVALV